MWHALTFAIGQIVAPARPLARLIELDSGLEDSTQLPGLDVDPRQVAADETRPAP